MAANLSKEEVYCEESQEETWRLSDYLQNGNPKQGQISCCLQPRDGSGSRMGLNILTEH